MTQRQTPRFPLDHSHASSYTSNNSSYLANQTYEIPTHLSRVHTDHVSYIPEPAHSSKYKQQRYQTKAQQNPSLKPRFSTNDLEDLLQKQMHSSSINTNPKQRELVYEQKEPVAYEKIPQKPRIQERTSSSRTNVPPIRGLNTLEAISSGSSDPQRMNRRQPVRRQTEAQSEIFSPTARSPTSRISRAIHEQYNESLHCVAIKDPKTVKQLENSSMSLFAGIIEEEEIQPEPSINNRPKDWKFYQRSYSSGLMTMGEDDKTIQNCKSLINLKFRSPNKSKTLPVKTSSQSQPRLQQQRPSIQTFEDDFQKPENRTLSIMEDDEEECEFEQEYKVNMMIVNQTFGQNKVDSPPGSTSTDDSIKKQPSIESPPPRSSVEKKSEAIQVDLIDLERNIIKKAPMRTYQERYVATLKVEEYAAVKEIVTTPAKEKGPITPTVTMSPEKANKVVAKKGFQSQINGNYYLCKNLSMAAFPVKAKTSSKMGGAGTLKVTQTPKVSVNSQMSFTQGYVSCKI